MASTRPECRVCAVHGTRPCSMFPDEQFKTSSDSCLLWCPEAGDATPPNIRHPRKFCSENAPMLRSRCTVAAATLQPSDAAYRHPEHFQKLEPDAYLSRWMRMYVAWSITWHPRQRVRPEPLHFASIVAGSALRHP